MAPGTQLAGRGGGAGQAEQEALLLASSLIAAKHTARREAVSDINEAIRRLHGGEIVECGPAATLCA